MTFEIIKDTQKIFCRPNALTSDDILSRNLRVDPETVPAVIKSR